MDLFSEVQLSELREPWIAVDKEERTALEAELVRETSEGHELYQISAAAIARRIDRDDVLYVHDAGISVVHLTYSPSELSPWPSTYTYESWQDFVNSRLSVDVLEWS